MREARIAALKKELNSISGAHLLFWQEGVNPSRDARAAPQRRRDRLREIMKELVELLTVPLVR
jgi:hypothetical protein